MIFMELLWDKWTNLETAFADLLSVVHNESHIQYSAFLLLFFFFSGLGYVQYFCTCFCWGCIFTEELQVDWTTELKFRMILISCKNNQENYRTKLGGTIAKYFSSAEQFSHISRGRKQWQSSNLVKNLLYIYISQANPDAAEKKVSEIGN